LFYPHPVYIGEGYAINAGDSNSHYLLALATLGNTTQIGLVLFLVASPKVAKASTVMTVMCRCRRWFCFANFTNVNDPSAVVPRPHNPEVEGSNPAPGARRDETAKKFYHGCLPLTGKCS
jgi:hypothetical protein